MEIKTLKFSYTILQLVEPLCEASPLWTESREFTHNTEIPSDGKIP